MRRFLFVPAFALLFGGLAAAVFARPSAAPPGGGPGRPREAAPGARDVAVVVELFTSEGCSSCPPAERFLRDVGSRRLAPGVAIVPLEYHVDYWDYLGWKDPFSDPAFTELQHVYARAAKERSVYTPEFVVGGRVFSSGTSASALAERLAVEAARPRARVEVRLEAPWVVVRVEDGGPGEDLRDVLLAVTESGLESEVQAGENRGERLAHAPVVRRLSTLGVLKDGAFEGRAPLDVAPSWKRSNVRFVAFVQERASRRIGGVGEAR